MYNYSDLTPKFTPSYKINYSSPFKNKTQEQSKKIKHMAENKENNKDKK